MALDPERLIAARAAAAALAETEREVERRRRDFRSRLKALHEGGASLRDMASALALSHQRIHQLVKGDEGEEAQPAAAGERKSCCLCGEAEVNSRPTCMRCAGEAKRLLAGEGLGPDSALRLGRRHQRVHCGGCGRRPEAGESFPWGRAGAICQDCLDKL